METEILATEPYQDFLFAMNSPVTRERYSTRLRSFLIHIGIEGTTMNERCRAFIEKMKQNEKQGNTKWAYACVVHADRLMLLLCSSIPVIMLSAPAF